MLIEAIKRAEFLIAHKHYKDAISALREIKNQIAEESKNSLYVDFLIGKALYLNAEFHESSKVFETLLERCENVFGRSHCFTLIVLDLLARSKSRCGCHKEASRFYLRESFRRMGKSPMDAKMICESYNLYCLEKENSYAIKS